MLTVSSPDVGIVASVEFDRWDDQRAQYRWKIEAYGRPDISGEGADLRLGSLKDPCDAEALRSLLDFFGAYCEALAYERRTERESDNSDMFPRSLRELAEGVDGDSLAMLAVETFGGEDE